MYLFLPILFPKTTPTGVFNKSHHMGAGFLLIFRLEDGPYPFGKELRSYGMPLAIEFVPCGQTGLVTIFETAFGVKCFRRFCTIQYTLQTTIFPRILPGFPQHDLTIALSSKMFRNNNILDMTVFAALVYQFLLN